MNAVEHIVECYFRICRHCFTMHDVKVEHGNKRQFDLLAVSLVGESEQYHVESSVMHERHWCPTVEELLGGFERKFFGVPRGREESQASGRQGRTYQREILAAYRKVGLDPAKIQRVFCCWIPPSEPDLDERLQNYCGSRGIRRIQVRSFRDQVVPGLENAVATANYDDEVLRALSLLKQRDAQGPHRAGGRSGG